VFVTILSACSSGRNAYKRGDYYKACIESIDRLRSSPKNEKAQEVLTRAYPLAQKTALREIDNALIANEADKYDVLVFQYERLNQLATEIFNCPKAYELIPQPTEYRAELSNAKKLAAEQSYNLGVTALNVGTMEQARIAYQHFMNANRYVSGYKDVMEKIDEARFQATLRVIVQRPLTSPNYQLSADIFYNNLISALSQNSQKRFVRFYTHEEARRENMKTPDQYLVLNFEDFSIGNVRETSNTKEVKRDSVVVGTVKVEGKTYNSYNTVKARITTFRREIISGGVLSIRIIDAQSNRMLQQKNFSGQYVWYTSWASFKGDDRALTKEEKIMCNQQPQIQPQNQDLFIEFT
jgi:tetratricopeptide (TPR) repeat protein